MLNISHLLVLSFLDLLLRLRAAVFVNVVAMRGFMSDADNGHITLSPNNLLGLQRANYLFHAALNATWTQSKLWLCICVTGAEGLL
jgi:hypothetical protein